MNNPRKTSWLDWLLYIGSKDERHRRSADRAGHIAFWIAFFAATIDLVIRWPGIASDGLRDWGTTVVSFVVILVGGSVYTGLWVLKGVTFLDGKKQRWLLGILGVVSGIGAGLLVGFSGGYGLNFPWSWVVAVVSGALVTVCSGAIYLGLDRWARQRADSGTVGRENGGPYDD